MMVNNKFVFIFCFLAVFAIFGSTLYFDAFIFDDGDLIFDNLKVVNANIREIFNYWSISNTPIIYNVWQTVSIIFGTKEELPFRILNLLFHFLNCFLFYYWSNLILNRFFLNDPKQKSFVERASFLGLIIFILHPVHVEAVAWISSLKEILAATFGLISFIFFLKNNEKPSSRYEAIMLTSYVLGMLTHPTVGALPFVYVWLDIYLYNKKIKDVFFENGFYLLVLGAAVIIHKTINPQVDPASEQAIYIRLAIALNSLITYLEKSFLPLGYSFDYMLSPDMIVFTTKASAWPKLKAFIAGIFIWLLILSYKKKKFHFFHYPLTLLTLLVSVNMGIIEYAFQNISTVSDRFLYFPSIAISLFFSYCYLLLIERGQRWKNVSAAVLSIYLLFFFSETVYRVHQWRSSSSVLEESIKNGFNSYVLNLSLGLSLLKEKKYGEANFHLRRAYDLAEHLDATEKKDSKLDSTEPASYLFRLYAETRDKEKGVAFFKEIMSRPVVLSPEFAWSVSEYFISINRWYEARLFIEYVYGIYPSSSRMKDLKLKMYLVKNESLIDSFVNLGLHEIDKKQLAQAKRYFENAIEVRDKSGIVHPGLESLQDLVKGEGNAFPSGHKK